MQEIIDNSYPYQLVDTNPDHFKYSFVSSGIKEIPKRVSIRPVINNYYNLAFGDIKINENGEEYIDDKSRNENKVDGDKILCTALICSLDFLTRFDDKKIVFFGNTPAKHKLYKMRLCRKVSLLNQFLILKGAIIKNYKVKIDEEGYKIIEQINPDKIQYEIFDIKNSNRYNFITFEIY